MKKLVTLLALLVLVIATQAQDFNQYFKNETLRLDYIFSGNRDRQQIAVDELVAFQDGSASATASTNCLLKETDK